MAKIKHIQSGKTYTLLGFVTYRGEPCAMVPGDEPGDPIRPMLAKMFTFSGQRTGKNNAPVSEEAMDCADLLLGELKRNFPSLQAPTSLHRWAQAIQRIVTIDGGSYADVRKVIVWCQRDPFWYKNIMSGDKLRKHYGKLLGLMRESGPYRANVKPFGDPGFNDL